MKIDFRWVRYTVLWSLAGPLLARQSSWPKMTQPLPAVPGVEMGILSLPTTVEGSCAEFGRPSLTIAGSKDELLSWDFVNEFTQAHEGNAGHLWYEGGSHGLREARDRVTADIVAWTNATFPE